MNTGLETTTIDLDSRVTVIEQNGNQTITELEVRLETLEGTAAEHETRLMAAETDVEGKISIQHFTFFQHLHVSKNGTFSLQQLKPD